MSQADELKNNPTPMVQEILDTIADTSSVSDSMALADLEQEDGSHLIIKSFQGEQPEVIVVGPESLGDDVDEALMSPRLPDSPDPEGIQDPNIEIPYEVAEGS